MGGATALRNCLRVAAVGAACCLLVIHCWHLQPVVAGGGEVEEAAEKFWKEFVEPTYPGSPAAFSPIQRAAFAEFAKAEKKRNLFKQSGVAAGVGGGLLGLLTPLLYARSVSQAVGAPSPSDSNVPLTEKPGSLEGSKGPGVMTRVKGALTPTTKGVAKGAGVLGAAMLLSSLGLLLASHVSRKKIDGQRRKYRAFVAKQREGAEKHRRQEVDPSASIVAAVAPFSLLRTMLSAPSAAEGKAGENQQQSKVEEAAIKPTVAADAVDAAVSDPRFPSAVTGLSAGLPGIMDILAAMAEQEDQGKVAAAAKAVNTGLGAGLPDIAEMMEQDPAKVAAAAKAVSTGLGAGLPNIAEMVEQDPAKVAAAATAVSTGLGAGLPNIAEMMEQDPAAAEAVSTGLGAGLPGIAKVIADAA